MPPPQYVYDHLDLFLIYSNEKLRDALLVNRVVRKDTLKELWLDYKRENNFGGQGGEISSVAHAMRQRGFCKTFRRQEAQRLGIDLRNLYLSEKGARVLRVGVDQHRAVKKAFLTNSSELVKDCHHIVISSDPRSDANGEIRLGAIGPESSVKVKFKITNSSSWRIRTLNRCMIMGRNRVFMIHDEHNTSTGHAHDILAGHTYTVNLRCGGVHMLGRAQAIVGFEFKRTDGSGRPFHIVRFVRAKLVDEVVMALQPTTPFTPRREKSVVHRPPDEAGRKPPKPREDKLNMEVNRLDDYREQKVRALLSAALWLEPFGHTGHNRQIKLNRHQEQLLRYPLDDSTHRQQFLLKMLLEHRQQEVDIHMYDMEDAELFPSQAYLYLEVPGLAENRPSLLRGDRLYAVDPRTSRKFEGYIHKVQKDGVLLCFSERFHHNFIRGQKYNIEYSVNPIPFWMTTRAVCMAEQNLFLPPQHYFHFPSKLSVDIAFLAVPEPIMRWHNPRIEKNPQQQDAVRHIVGGTSGCAPYLIFGPPGTGKTVTVVEAIKQVYFLRRHSHILACTPSNSAADLIVQRLLDSVVEERHILRLNAYSRSHETISEDIRGEVLRVSKVSSDGCFFFPSLEEIRKYRIVICTLVTAGRLVSAGMPQDHFDYVFIDECGHAVESEALIVVASMVKPGRTQLVLAGDPRQLGPVIRSPIAVKYGLHISLLERLMENCEVYQRQAAGAASTNDIGSYNPRVVTKLLRNYRSHPAILKVPNEEFYNGELLVFADQIEREKLTKWEHLTREARRRQFPIIFHGIEGEDMRQGNSPSFFNPEEVSLVRKYVMWLRDCRNPRISASQIGVISPYHMQVVKIRGVLRSNYEAVKVGSVEEFQGQERSVIIISTVRSQDKYLAMDEDFKLGFLKNPKRFNVAITRAKSLLVVIGNPFVLARDAHWKLLLDYCLENGAYTGCEYKTPDAEEEEVLHQFESLNLGTADAIVASATARDEEVDHREDPGWRREE